MAAEHDDPPNLIPTGVLSDLVYDDESIEELIAGESPTAPRPADVGVLVEKGFTLSESEMTAYLARARSAPPGPVEPSAAMLSPGDEIRGLEKIWESCRRSGDHRYICFSGVTLAFAYETSGRRESAHRIWAQLGAIQGALGAPGEVALADGFVNHAHDAVDGVLGNLQGRGPTGVFPAGSIGDWPDGVFARDPLSLCASALREIAASDRARISPNSMGPIELCALRVATLVEVTPKVDPILTASANRLVIAIRNYGSPDAALPLAEWCLEVRELALGRGHNLVALSLLNLASLHLLVNDLDRAEPLLEQARGIAPDRDTTYYWLAKLYRARGAAGDLRREIDTWQTFLQKENSDPSRATEARTRLAELFSDT
jgi:hypothetical protein